MVSDEGTELMFWGREGVEYQKNGPEDYEWLIELDQREQLGLPMVLNIVLGKAEYAEAVGNPYAPEMKKARAAVEDGTYSDFLDPVPYTTEMRETLTDIGTFVDENLTSFIIGKRPLSEFDAFIEEWHKRGGTELLKALTAEMEKLGK